MTNPNLTVLRADSPDPPDVRLDGWAGAIVTVITGKVVGEIIRSIFDGGYRPGRSPYRYRRARPTLADVAIQTDDAGALRDLARVVAFLADEFAKAEPSAREN